MSRSGIIYGTYCFSSWLAPPLVLRLGPRWSMVLAAASYVFQVSPCLHRNIVYCTVLYCTVQVSQYLYLNTVTVYLAAVLLGFGGPIIWTAQVSYNSHFCCHNHSPLCCVQGTFLTRNSDLRLCHHHEELGHILGHIEDLGLDREHGGLLLVPGPGDPAAAHLGAAGRGADRRVGAGHRAAAAPQEVFSRVLTLEMSHGCTPVYSQYLLLSSGNFKDL